MKKNALAMVLVLMLGLFGVTAACAEDNLIVLPDNDPVIASVSGTIEEVRNFYNENGDVVPDKVFVEIKTDEGGDATFMVNTITCPVKGKSLAEMQAGDTFIGSFDASRPMTMQYPPQYSAVAVEIH